MPENVVFIEDSWAPEDRRDKTQCIKRRRVVLSHLQTSGASLQLCDGTGINIYKEKDYKYLTHRLVKKKHC